MPGWWSGRRTGGGAAIARPLGSLGAPEHLCIDWLLSQFARGRSAAQQAYVAFVTDGGEPVWDHLKAQVYLGTEEFVAQMKARIEAADALFDVPRDQRLPAPKPLTRYEAESRDRAEAMSAAHAGGHTLRAIARHYGVHESTVSRAVRRQEGRNA